MQLAADLETYSRFLQKTQILAVYGGTDISKQIKTLKKGVQIVVGTPGRTLDLIKRKKLDLGSLRFVVFDEADEMLSMGFKDDMDSILEVTPKEKQVLLFSATMPPEIEGMVMRYMTDPHRIVIGHKNTGNKNIVHKYYEVHGRKKYEVLKRIADINHDIYGIVFCRTRRETKEIAAKLGQDGYNADAIHGDLSQSQRDIVMDRFRSRQIQLLVATDVAARGIDVQELTHVINYNLPDELAIYVHRSGRTGRANNEGVSIIITNGRDHKKLRQLEKIIQRPLEKAIIPSGIDVVKSQLKSRINRLKNATINEKALADYLPAIEESLSELSKAEIIQKFVSLELNDSLKYYKNAEDLNDSIKGKRSSNRKDRKNNGDSRRSESSKAYDRFYINLGEKNHMNPKKLLSFINNKTPNHSLDVGKIEIMKGFSFFDVGSDDSHLVMKKLNAANFEGKNVIVKPVNKKDGNNGGSGKGKRRNKSYFGKKRRSKSKR